MDIKVIFGIIAIILTFVGYVHYIVDIFQGKTKPHLYTWLSWGVLTLIIFIIQFQDNAGAGTWMTGFVGLISLFISIISIKYGTKDITKKDHICLGGIIIGIVCWLFLKNPLYTLSIVCGLDILGFIPTIRKSWYKPYEENIQFYIITTIRYGIAIGALSHYTLESSLYLVLWLMLNFLMVIFLLWRRQIIISIK